MAASTEAGLSDDVGESNPSRTAAAVGVDAARFVRHSPGDRWFVDETYVKIGGSWRYVYRAIDQHGQVIDVLVSPRRDTAASKSRDDGHHVLHTG